MLPSECATSVYIHFPWCQRKCPYCDFASYRPNESGIPHEHYADAVLRELDLRWSEVRERPLQSIFFGGGTPSMWSPEALGRVLREIVGRFEAELETLEVTVECNPASFDEQTAWRLRQQGVSRVSIGVQALESERLRYLGRIHSAEDALNALRCALEIFPQVSADLIFGTPSQTPEEFECEIQKVLDLGVNHLSVYALTIEPDTQFEALRRKGRLQIATEDLYAALYLRAEQVLTDRGLSHYEVSNYAASGEECVHNLHYWNGGEYLGLGAGAVGRLPISCVSSEECSSAESRICARRFRNHPLPKNYMASWTGLPEESVEYLSAETLVRERLMLGLRTAAGLDISKIQTQTGLEVTKGRSKAIRRRAEQGDLLVDQRRWSVPLERWLYLDGIVLDLF
ncbi:MAG: radical SAM family heme chaperone HemW [Myxococcota bacterium]